VEEEQARGAMSTSPRSTNRGHAFVATFVFVALFWTLLLSVSPQLHACIHTDANRTEHVCAITLITSGSYDHPAQPPIISAPPLKFQFRASAAHTSTWVKPLFLQAHIFSHAPPGNS